MSPLISLALQVGGIWILGAPLLKEPPETGFGRTARREQEQNRIFFQVIESNKV